MVMVCLGLLLSMLYQKYPKSKEPLPTPIPNKLLDNNTRQLVEGKIEMSKFIKSLFTEEAKPPSFELSTKLSTSVD